MYRSKKNLLNHILAYIDEDGESDDHYERLIDFINEKHISQNRNDLYELLVLLSKIINDHHRRSLFSSKIKRIIRFLKSDIKQTFSNFDLFSIFKKSILILPFLFKEQIIVFDDIIFRYFIEEIL